MNKQCLSLSYSNLSNICVHLYILNFLFVFLQLRNLRNRRTLINARARRALRFSVEANDESEESDCPPDLIGRSSSEDTDSSSEDEDDENPRTGRTLRNAGARRAVDGNAEVSSCIVLFTFQF